jgi:hypothetical protein
MGSSYEHSSKLTDDRKLAIGAAFSLTKLSIPRLIKTSCAGSSAVEQLVYTQLVGGSIPSPRTTFRQC